MIGFLYEKIKIWYGLLQFAGLQIKSVIKIVLIEKKHQVFESTIK